MAERIFSSIVSIVFFSLACLVFSKNPRSPAHRFFSAAYFGTAIWVLANFWESEPIPQYVAEFLLHLDFASAVFIMTMFACFSLNFPRPLAHATLINQVLLVAMASLSSLSFTRFVVRDIGGYEAGIQLQFKQGPLFGFYTSYIVGCLLLTYCILFWSWRRACGVDRTRIAYVLFGIASATIIAVAINLFLSQSLAISTFISRIGIYGVLLLAGSIAIAIVKHQLMDIELFIKRSLVFAGLSICILGMVTFATFSVQELVGRYIQVPAWMLALVATIAVVLIYDPIKAALVDITDRYLFQKRYDYKDLLLRFSKEALVILDLPKLVDTTVHTVSEIMRLEGCALLLLNRLTNRYELMASTGSGDHCAAIEEVHPLIGCLKGTKGHVVLTDESSSGLAGTLSPGVEVFLPLEINGELMGILALGHKKSDESYTKDDMEILSTLANTEAIAISNALLVAEVAQKEKLAVVGTLASAINHEVCNPINNIKMQADGLLMEMEGGFLNQLPQQERAKVEDFLKMAVEEVDRTAAITTRLSNFAKPIQEPMRKAVEVKKAVEDVLAILKQDLSSRHVAVEKILPDGIPPVFVDRGQLHEILFNLIRNGSQAIEKNGTITVQARFDGMDRVAIHIIDTGCGMPAEQLKHLFTPFFTTKGEKGTGLGLFVVKRLVESNAGTIAVQSRVGSGTTFVVEFPAAQQ